MDLLARSKQRFPGKARGPLLWQGNPAAFLGFSHRQVVESTEYNEYGSVNALSDWIMLEDSKNAKYNLMFRVWTVVSSYD